MKTWLFVLLISMLPVCAFAQSTSPNPLPEPDAPALTKMQLQAAGDASDVITFSEFPIGTPIDDQYQDIGIIFGGSGPFITTDGANPTSPVLSGTPLFQGDITGSFVEPGTDRPTEEGGDVHKIIKYFSSSS